MWHWVDLMSCVLRYLAVCILQLLIRQLESCMLVTVHVPCKLTVVPGHIGTDHGLPKDPHSQMRPAEAAKFLNIGSYIPLVGPGSGPCQHPQFRFLGESPLTEVCKTLFPDWRWPKVHLGLHGMLESLRAIPRLKHPGNVPGWSLDDIQGKDVLSSR